VVLALIGTFPGARWVVIAAVIASGAFVGLNNTLVTTAVMSISPVPRSVASAAYGFVRFIGGGLAPYAAGQLVERTNVHVPFLLGAVVVLVGAALLATVHGALEAADAAERAPVLPDSLDAEVGLPGRAA
jgi:MFS transporter, ACDE family, multidrug resistance protein